MSFSSLDLVGLARGRLLVDETERQRLTERVYLFKIGRIARAVNIRAISVENKSYFDMTELKQAQTHPLLVQIPPPNHIADICDFTLDAPLLGLRTNDGSLVMIDGRRRLARALALGRPGLQMCVVREADLPEKGLVEDLKKDSTLLRTTLAHPAQRINAERLSVAMIPIETDVDRHRGAPSIDEIGDTLRSHYILSAIKAVEIETFLQKNKLKPPFPLEIYRNSPQLLKEELWIAIWRTEYGGPTPPANWNTVADQAARVIRRIEGFENRTVYRNYLRNYLSGLSVDEINKAHSEIKLQMIIFSKAYLRYKLWNSMSNDLSTLDEKPFNINIIQEIHDVYNGESTHGDTDLSLQDQAKLAQITEINPTLIYKQYYRYNAFFESLIYVKRVQKNIIREVFPSMFEMYMHRRAMEIQEQQDSFSANWRHLFPLFHDAGLTDLVICQKLLYYDKQMLL